MRESDLSRLIQIAVSARGHRAWRFNVGLFYTERGQPVRAGIAGASDLVGISARGRFIALEIKLPGRKPTARQQRFLDQVAGMGGIAGVARSIEDALDIIGEG